jgi:hypothetical protein
MFQYEEFTRMADLNKRFLIADVLKAGGNRTYVFENAGYWYPELHQGLIQKQTDKPKNSLISRIAICYSDQLRSRAGWDDLLLMIV